jgi:hypothetical protein
VLSIAFFTFTAYAEAAFITLMAHITAAPPTQRLIEAAGATDPIAGYLQYGVLGLVVVGFMTGWIAPGPQVKALAAENTRLSTLIEGQLFPILTQYAGTMEKAAMALEKAAEAMDRQAERERLQLEQLHQRGDRS